VLVYTLADGGEGGSEVEHVFVLGLVANFTPPGVIAGLLAALGVASGGLEMAVGEGADPDAFPGGRDDEGLDAGEGLLVFSVTGTEGSVVGGAVGETGAGSMARDAGAGVVYVTQAGGAGGVDWVGNGGWRDGLLARRFGRCGAHGAVRCGVGVRRNFDPVKCSAEVF